MLDQPYMTDLIEANSMAHMPDKIDIYSASWGPTDDGKTVDGPRNATMRAIVNGVNKVRRRSNDSSTKSDYHRAQNTIDSQTMCMDRNAAPTNNIGNRSILDNTDDDDSLRQGRNGKGSIYVWASGDGGPDDDCNCDGYAASMWTVSINSATNDGQTASYDESCSSTLASTFSNGKSWFMDAGVVSAVSNL